METASSTHLSDSQPETRLASGDGDSPPQPAGRRRAGRDDGFWEEFVRRHGGRVRRAAWGALRGRGLAPRADRIDDLTQEIYCRLLQRGSGSWGLAGRSGPQVAGYLRRVARSVLVDRLRAAGALKRGGIGLGAAGDEPAEVADRAEGPEQRLLRRERRRRFAGCCRRAAGSVRPCRDLRIFMLAVVGGWTSREIAERLGGGLRPSGVDSVVWRMRRRLAAAGHSVPSRR